MRENRIFAENVLEFATGGGDILSFWRVSKDNVLESHDIRIPEIGTSEISITSISYCYHGSGKTYLLAGLQSGEIICVDVKKRKIIDRTKFCTSEILQLRFSNAKKSFLISTLRGELFKVNFDDM